MGALIARPVDEEGRRPGRAAGERGCRVLLDASGAMPCPEIGNEGCLVKTDGRSLREEVDDGQMVFRDVGRRVEELVVHLPEPPLRTGGLGGFGSQLCIRAGLTVSEVAEDESYLGGQATSHLVYRQVSAMSGSGFVVPVFQERQRGIQRSTYVIVFDVDGRFEAFRCFSRRVPVCGIFQQRSPKGGRDDGGCEDADSRSVRDGRVRKGQVHDEQRDREPHARQHRTAEQVQARQTRR